MQQQDDAALANALWMEELRNAEGARSISPRTRAAIDAACMADLQGGAEPSVLAEGSSRQGAGRLRDMSCDAALARSMADADGIDEDRALAQAIADDDRREPFRFSGMLGSDLFDGFRTGGPGRGHDFTVGAPSPNVDNMSYEELLALGERIGSVQQVALSQAEVDLLPTRRIPDDIAVPGRHSDDDARRCAVCQEDYVAGEVVRTLPCLHAFHTNCIDRWLTGQTAGARACPVCHVKVNFDDGADDV